jgi:hypothetical protein
MKHSDFIVYVDESGDHCLTRIDPLYPLFVLSLCIFHKSTYCEQIILVNECMRQGVHFELVIADKRTNSEGLQLADLTARPMGLSVLHPEQPSRAAAIIRTKLAGDLKILTNIT